MTTLAQARAMVDLVAEFGQRRDELRAQLEAVERLLKAGRALGEKLGQRGCRRSVSIWPVQGSRSCPFRRSKSQ